MFKSVFLSPSRMALDTLTILTSILKVSKTQGLAQYPDTEKSHSMTQPISPTTQPNLTPTSLLSTQQLGYPITDACDLGEILT